MTTRSYLISTQCFYPVTGGIENMMTGLAKSLVARGHNVTVLADGRRGAEDAQDLGSVIRFAGWKPLRQRLKAFALSRRAKKVHTVFFDSWKSLEHARPIPGVRFVCGAAVAPKQDGSWS